MQSNITISVDCTTGQSIRHQATIAQLGTDYTPLDIPAGWILSVKRNYPDGNQVTVQYAFT